MSQMAELLNPLECSYDFQSPANDLVFDSCRLKQRHIRKLQETGTSESERFCILFYPGEKKSKGKRDSYF